jgi:hypothetical protein
MDPPTWEEFNETIHGLPNGKATGPSGISYEMIKHASEIMKKVLLKLVILCLEQSEIPSNWKFANVYPIPKPNLGIVNWSIRTNHLTRHDKKTMVAILNRRLSTIMVNNNVLKGYQFAGLPLKSTFEPLRILNEIIQDAYEEKRVVDIGPGYVKSV